jgi:hypothetical protein
LNRVAAGEHDAGNQNLVADFQRADRFFGEREEKSGHGRILSGEGFLVNLTPIPDGDQMQFVSFQVKPVNDAIVANPQPEGVHALHPVMLKTPQIQPQFVNSPLKAFLEIRWQSEETTVKSVGTNLCGRADRGIHGLRTR